jgi:hypothetical protein
VTALRDTRGLPLDPEEKEDVGSPRYPGIGLEVQQDDAYRSQY